MVKKKIKIISSFIILILFHGSIYPCLINDEQSLINDEQDPCLPNDEQNPFKHFGVSDCIRSIRKMMFNINKDEVHLKNFFLGVAIYLKYQYTNPCKLLSDEEAQNLTHAHSIIQKIYGSGYNNGQRYGYMNRADFDAQGSLNVTATDLATEVLPLLNELQRAKAFDTNNEDPLEFAAFFQYLRECEIGTNELGQQTLRCPPYHMKGMFKAAQGVRKTVEKIQKDQWRAGFISAFCLFGIYNFTYYSMNFLIKRRAFLNQNN